MVDEIKQPKPILTINGKRQIIITSLLALVVSGAAIIYTQTISKQRSPEVVGSTKSTLQAKIRAVSAIGRLEPEGEAIKVSAPPDLGGAKVDKLMVTEGEIVKKDQTIAILDGYSRQKAKVAIAEKDVKISQANLAIIKAGSKKGEISAQKATISKLEAELAGQKASFRAKIARQEAELEGEINTQKATIERLKAQSDNAEREYTRYQKLAEHGVVSDSNLDQIRLKKETNQNALIEVKSNYIKTRETLTQQILETKANQTETLNTLEKQIIEANATLAKIQEVRPVDIKKAEAELAKSQANYESAKEDLKLAIVTAPFAGQILKIYTHQGEKVSETNGIVEMGQTDKMLAVAEIYEGDIAQVKLGQTAIIKSENGTFAEIIKGTVAEIGFKVGKKEVLSTDPAADIDVRVIEVKIRLTPKDSQKVARLTNSKVTVEILL